MNLQLLCNHSLIQSSSILSPGKQWGRWKGGLTFQKKLKVLFHLINHKLFGIGICTA